MRESSVRGPAIDLSEFERRMRAAETPQVAPPREGGRASTHFVGGAHAEKSQARPQDDG